MNHKSTVLYWTQLSKLTLSLPTHAFLLSKSISFLLLASQPALVHLFGSFTLLLLICSLFGLCLELEWILTRFLFLEITLFFNVLLYPLFVSFLSLFFFLCIFRGLCLVFLFLIPSLRLCFGSFSPFPFQVLLFPIFLFAIFVFFNNCLHSSFFFTRYIDQFVLQPIWSELLTWPLFISQLGLPIIWNTCNGKSFHQRLSKFLWIQ